MASSWDPAKNKTYQILRAAEDGGYGIVAPIAYNLEHVLAFIRAAERKRCPIIIQVFPWAITFSYGLLVHAAAHAARSASVPVAIHLDHAQDESFIRDAAENLPLDSIMIDMSHHEMDQNLRKTKELVQFCHSRGIATEAEPGRLEGGEDGIVNPADLQGALTTEDDVRNFIATGVDFLAPCIGNIHGDYSKHGPMLDFALLSRIRSQTAGEVHLVLHGTNDFTDALMKKCISGGFSKINVNKLVLSDYLEYMREKSAALPLTTLMEEGLVKVQKSVEKQMEACRSSVRTST